MVIDTSAIGAILLHEPDELSYLRALQGAAECHMSALNAYESRVLLWRRLGDAAVAAFEALLRDAGIAVHPFSEDQSRSALAAYRRYGKGTGHPAQLNLGDCAAYALARSLDLPLLYKGNDFARTDLPAAI